MAFYTRADMRDAFRRSDFYRPGRTADQALQEATASYRRPSGWDVFLSHSALDKEMVIGVRQKLLEEGRSAYVDWIDDPQLDRSNVNAETAGVLRKRMQSCRSMIYALSPNSSASKWMPWELGFFDGNKSGQIALMPIVDQDSDFRGQEYLGLYAVVEKDTSPLRRGATRVVTKDHRVVAFSDFATAELGARL